MAIFMGAARLSIRWCSGETIQALYLRYPTVLRQQEIPGLKPKKFEYILNVAVLVCFYADNGRGWMLFEHELPLWFCLCLNGSVPVNFTPTTSIVKEE